MTIPVEVTLKLTPEYVAECKRHATEVLPTVLHIYQSRNPGMTKEQAYENLVVGKLGEGGVWVYLSHCYPEAGVSPPDMSLHYYQKTHGADMTLGKRQIHIKSQRQKWAEIDRDTWVFEHKCPTVQKPTPDDYFAFCQVADTLDEVTIRLFIPAVYIHKQGLFQGMRNGNTTKRAVYYAAVVNTLVKAGHLPASREIQ